MTPTSASEDEVKRYELFCSAASREAYLLNQSTLFVLLAQSILMAASVTNASGSSRFLVCCPAIVGALILIATISTMVSGDGRIKSQWRVYLKGIASEGEIICQRVIGVSCCLVFSTIKTKAFISLSVGACFLLSNQIAARSCTGVGRRGPYPYSLTLTLPQNLVFSTISYHKSTVALTSFN
jgi:hypothetical protein